MRNDPRSDPDRLHALQLILVTSLLLVMFGAPSCILNGAAPQTTPSAPFGRGSPPALNNDVGLALGNPYGYSWSSDGSLTFEMWAYNGRHLPVRMDCDVLLVSQGGEIAHEQFSGIDGTLPPSSEHATKLRFSSDHVTKKFVALNDIAIHHDCSWTSV